MFYLTRMCLQNLCYSAPAAAAIIRGSSDFPEIRGNMYLYDMPEGCIVMLEVVGLPDNSFYGLHIHEGARCGSTTPGGEAFLAAGGHFNPENTMHPYHAGDLPPLLSHNGYAWMAVYTERFSTVDVLERTVIIHGMPDDFVSQPAGNAGKRIACGKIMA